MARSGPAAWPGPTGGRSSWMKSPRSPRPSSRGCSASSSTANSSRWAPRSPSRSTSDSSSSTRENLPALVEQGKFRRELFDRINDVCLKLPPLRQRGQDIVRLAEHFRERFAVDFVKPSVGFSPDAIDLLARHDWPGNVRELESVIQRGVALSQGPKVTSANLAVGLNPSRATRPPAYSPRPHLHTGLGLRPLKEALEEPEKQIIIQALRALNWNRQETARVLDINRTTLYKKMKKYGLLMEEPALLN